MIISPPLSKIIIKKNKTTEKKGKNKKEKNEKKERM